MPRANGPPPPNGAAPRPGPPQGAPANRPPPAGAPAPGARPGQPGYKAPPPGRPAGVPPAGAAPAPTTPGQPDIPTLTAAALANASPMEQKQMLGEVIYMKIAS